MPPKPSLISRISMAPGVPLVAEETSGPSLSSTNASGSSKRPRPSSVNSEEVPDSDKGDDDGGGSAPGEAQPELDELDSSPPFPEGAGLDLTDEIVEEFERVEKDHMLRDVKAVRSFFSPVLPWRELFVV